MSPSCSVTAFRCHRLRRHGKHTSRLDRGHRHAERPARGDVQRGIYLDGDLAGLDDEQRDTRIIRIGLQAPGLRLKRMRTTSLGLGTETLGAKPSVSKRTPSGGANSSPVGVPALSPPCCQATTGRRPTTSRPTRMRAKRDSRMVRRCISPPSRENRVAAPSATPNQQPPYGSTPSCAERTEAGIRSCLTSQCEEVILPSASAGVPPSLPRSRRQLLSEPLASHQGLVLFPRPTCSGPEPESGTVRFQSTHCLLPG